MGGGAGGLVLVFAVAAFLRLLLSVYLPPLVDVYYYDSQAVHALLSGSDPYGYHYAGIPAWLSTPGAEDVYAYLPGVLLFLAPFGALWDIRLGLIVADVVIAWCLYSLRPRISGAAAAFYLLTPWALLFSTSYPNNTLVAMVFVGLALLWEAKGRGILSASAFGVALASSQFVWFLYPFFAYRALKEKRFVHVGVGILIAAVIVLPFLLWNPSAFIYDTVSFQFVRPPQEIVTPMVFGFNVNPTLSGITQTLFGVTVPAPARGIVLLALLVYLLYGAKTLSRLVLNGSVFLLAIIFILPNTFSWWYLEFPFQTLLVWFILSRGGDDPILRAPTTANA